MRRRWLGVLLMMASIVAVQRTHVALACSVAEQFVVTTEHFRTGDVNDPDGPLGREYRAWRGDDDATIEIRGVYVRETISTVEPEGDWSRGSVSVVAEMWGEWPTDRRPTMIAPQDRSGEPVDDCGWGPGGTTEGTRSYAIVTTNRDIEFRAGPGTDDTLTLVYGTPTIAERNNALERQLIAQIQRPSESSTPIFVAVGIGAIAVAAGVMYLSRRSAPDDDGPPASGR